MGTRCGAIDPGVLLYLLREEGMRLDQIEDLLNHGSGLLGFSGISSDVRTLLASVHPHATEALELFAYRISQAVASHAVAAEGIDALASSPPASASTPRRYAPTSASDSPGSECIWMKRPTTTTARASAKRTVRFLPGSSQPTRNG